MKYTNVVLTIIAVCLLYVAFAKPVPKRYILKEHKEDSEALMTSEETIVFDTATGKLYSIYNATITTPDSTKTPPFTTEFIYKNNMVDFINNTFVEREAPTEIKKDNKE